MKSNPPADSSGPSCPGSGTPEHADSKAMSEKQRFGRQEWPSTLPVPRLRRSLSFRSARVANRRNILTTALASMLVLIVTTWLRSRHHKVEGNGRFPDMTFRYADMWEHNAALAARLDRCRELGMLQDTSVPIPPHLRLSDTEERRYQSYGCGTNETTVILIGEDSFVRTFRGDVRGEDIWSMSTMTALKAYNYAYMFSSMGAWRPEVNKTVELWRQYKQNIRFVLLDPMQTASCYGAERDTCLKSAGNPDGIDDWRILTYWYWDDAQNPLGHRFTLSPSSHDTKNRLLPLSIEHTCAPRRFVPHTERRDQAYLLAKLVQYFEPSFNFTWTLPGLRDISEQESVQFAAGLRGEADSPIWDEIADAGITNLGPLDQAAFYDQLGHSKVLVGIGKPRSSPSPWDALCMGVPFINPIMSWDERDPSDRSGWHHQQWRMSDMEPPYVYSVHAHNLSELQDAIHTAIHTPIDRYIPEHMRFEYVRDTIAELVEWDWQQEARVAKQELSIEEGLNPAKQARKP